MIPRNYSSQAVVIKRVNFSESDRLITLYSKDYGKVRLLAKGVRRPASRKRGHIEIFTLVKFAASQTKSYGLMTEAESLRNFDYGKDTRRISVAYFVVETVDKLTSEGESNRSLYKLLVNYLSRLETVDGLRQFRLKFVTEILTILGFWPDGKEMPDPDSILMDATERKLNSMRVGKQIS